MCHIREIVSKILNYIVPTVSVAFLLFLMVTSALRLSNSSALNGVTLASFPTDTSITAILDGSFQNSFDKWMTDKFYKHTEIVKVHNQIEYSIFNDGMGDWIQGREGYLFSKSQTYNAVGGDYVNKTSWEDYLEYAESMSHLQKLLNAAGKDFVVLLTPVKAEIYTDKLPWYERLIATHYEHAENTKRKMLLKALNQYDVNYYETTEDLKAMRGNADFDVFSKTGHHWTLTAAATEMNTILEKVAEKSLFTSWPSVTVTGINDILFGTDKDILNLQNVNIPKLAERYTSPVVSYISTDDSAYLFGTSFGWEITGSLYKDADNRAFDSLVFEEYFTNVNEYDANGSRRYTFSASNTPDDVGVMKYVTGADVIIMEQQASLGVMNTHKKFIDYVTSCLESDYFMTKTRGELEDSRGHDYGFEEQQIIVRGEN